MGYTTAAAGIQAWANEAAQYQWPGQGTPGNFASVGHFTQCVRATPKAGRFPYILPIMYSYYR